jgi:nucleoside-diphosphate-sugar epimerase
VTADIATDALAPHFKGAEAVVHLAWQFQPTHRPMETWRANVLGSGRVFDAVSRADVPIFVHASSVGAYSPGTGRRVDESWPTDSVPTAGYGREKAYVERILDDFEARHPEVRVARLRPAFIFQRRAATEQRRIFAGPFVPNWIVRPGLLPVIPIPSGLRFQAVAAHDVADAYLRAVMCDSARGAFNIAADPVIDGATLADLLGTRAITVPAAAARAFVVLAWNAHIIPTEPALLDLVLALPQLDCSKARSELGWNPTMSSVDAMRSLLEGFAAGAGAASPPLVADSIRGRVEEAGTGVEERNTTERS